MRRLGGDRLLVCDDWLSFYDSDLGEILKVFEADLDMELAAASDDVLAALFSVALNQRVGLGELIEAVNEFR